MTDKEMMDAYHQVTYGYQHPHYMEITLESFREMTVKLSWIKRQHEFLSWCDEQKIPNNAIVVVEENQPFRLLTDDEGRLLEFK